MKVWRTKIKKRTIIAFFTLILYLLSPLCCFSQEKLSFQERLEVANRAFEEQKFEEAIKIYSSLLQENPDNLALKVKLARAFYLGANKNPDYFYQAAKEYKELIQKVPDFSFPYLELGQIAYLLGLSIELEGKQSHAQGLYKSALDWYEKYIKLEEKSGGFENKKEIATTKVLEAVVYSRMGEKEKALSLLEEAKKEYKNLLLENKEIPTLYDYFIRSGIEYMNLELYNQALIYLEGAWLIEPRPQVKSLFEIVTKNKKISISLPEPLIKKEEKLSSEKKMEEKIEELTSKLTALEKKLLEFAEIKEEVGKLKGEVEKLVQEKKSKKEGIATPISNAQQGVSQQEIQTLQEISQELTKINNRVDKLEEKIKGMEEKINQIKSVADMFGILKIQIQEIKKTIEDFKEKSLQKEQTKNLPENRD